MNIQQIHRQAISLAREADLHLENDDLENYHSSIKEAFRLEKRAAEELKDRYESEPTRSVLYRSAASLAFKCANYSDAIDLIIEALKGNPFEEIRLELLDLLKKATESNIIERKKIASPYLGLLKNNSINIKLEEKGNKYGGAFSLSSMVDFCKSLQDSYKNFAAVQLARTIKQEDVKDFDKLVTKFRNEVTLLGADTKFSSFGISVSEDRGLMTPFDVHTSEFKQMRKNLFSNFKEEVLLPNYEDATFQEMIVDKYNDEERNKIYGTILKSLNKNYRISITDQTFEKKLKEFKPASLKVQHTLVPKILIDSFLIESDINLLKKIEQVIGNKRTVISNEKITNFTLSKEFSELSWDKRRIYFNYPHTVQMIFEDNLFRIEDTVYGFVVKGLDFDSVVRSYATKFISEYIRLLSTTDLSESDRELMKLYEVNVMRDW